MNRFLLYLLAGLFSFTLMVACNNSTEEQPNNEPTTTEPTTTETPTESSADSQTDAQPEETSDEQTAILGTWYTEETISGEELTFREDGTFSAASRGEEVTGKWEAAEGKIKMGDDLSTAEAMPYELKEGKLIIGELTYKAVE